MSGCLPARLMKNKSNSSKRPAVCPYMPCLVLLFADLQGPEGAALSTLAAPAAAPAFLYHSACCPLRSCMHALLIGGCLPRPPPAPSCLVCS